MRAARVLPIGVAALVGGALAALVQWWPTVPGCAGCAGAGCPPCPTHRVAGHITIAGVLLGIAVGALVAAVTGWLAARERNRRRDYGEL